MADSTIPNPGVRNIFIIRAFTNFMHICSAELCPPLIDYNTSTELVNKVSQYTYDMKNTIVFPTDQFFLPTHVKKPVIFLPISDWVEFHEQDLNCTTNWQGEIFKPFDDKELTRALRYLKGLNKSMNLVFKVSLYASNVLYISDKLFLTHQEEGAKYLAVVVDEAGDAVIIVVNKTSDLSDFFYPCLSSKRNTKGQRKLDKIVIDLEDANQRLSEKVEAYFKRHNTTTECHDMTIYPQALINYNFQVKPVINVTQLNFWIPRAKRLVEVIKEFTTIVQLTTDTKIQFEMLYDSFWNYIRHKDLNDPEYYYSVFLLMILIGLFLIITILACIASFCSGAIGLRCTDGPTEITGRISPSDGVRGYPRFRFTFK